MQNDPLRDERGAKNKVFHCISFFDRPPLLKEKSYLFQKVVLFARRSAAERSNIACSFGEERNKIVRRFMWKGKRLLVVLDGRE